MLVPLSEKENVTRKHIHVATNSKDYYRWKKVVEEIYGTKVFSQFVRETIEEKINQISQ